MTPKRIAELRRDFEDGLILCHDDISELLVSAEREVKLREAVWRVRDSLYADCLYGYSADLMAALETKGGE